MSRMPNALLEDGSAVIDALSFGLNLPVTGAIGVSSSPELYHLMSFASFSLPSAPTAQSSEAILGGNKENSFFFSYLNSQTITPVTGTDGNVYYFRSQLGHLWLENAMSFIV
jgi:hypothetical protein